MIRTIVAPLGGGASDQAVLESAWLAARAFNAHVDYLHNFLDAGEAASAMPQVSYLHGAALHAAMQQLGQRGEERAAAALHHFAEFCRHHGLPAQAPAPGAQPTAGMLQTCGAPLDNLLFQARHHDLVVMARPRAGDGMPADLPGRILLQGGQPLLLVPAQAPQRLPGTVMIAWKETAEAARAVTLALPFLQAADRVLLTSVAEGHAGAAESIQAVQEHLRWHGVEAQPRTVARGKGAVMDTLWSAVADCGADLLVMGGYSRGPTRELLFGGCTQAVLSGGERPVLIAH